MQEGDEIINIKGKTLEEGEWKDIVVIHPNGMIEGFTCLTTLENMQALVGGYIEVVPYFNKISGIPCIALCDEEGKLKGYPVNNRATLEWSKVCPQLTRNGQLVDMLVGDIVVLTAAAKKEFER